MKSVIVLFISLFIGSHAFSHEGSGGLESAAILQRTIIHQCILNAEQEYGIDRSKLPVQFSDSDWSYLYILGLKLYETRAIFTYKGEAYSFDCAKEFPWLAWTHFFNGNKDETLFNIEKEIRRMRPDLFSAL